MVVYCRHMKITSILLAAITLISMSCREERKSEQFEERGTVVGKAFTPAHDDTTLSWNTTTNTMDTDTTHYNDKWAVTFTCEHGVTFTVSGEAGSPAANVYAKLNPGEPNVYILYRKVSFVNKDKKTGLESLEFKDYSFEDAGYRSFEKPREK